MSLRRASSRRAPPPLDFRLHERQSEAFFSKATEILYGGAAGGGKSHLLRLAAIMFASSIDNLQVYLFRRQLPDLVKNHIEGPKGFRALLAPWTDTGWVEIVEDQIRFWNGSKIWLCHCKDEADRFNYQGSEIHVLLMDELTHFTETIYRFLRARVRAVGVKAPPEFKVEIPRILCGSNPGGVGHQWVKASFIDGVKPFDITNQSDEEGGMARQFIPARLDDNPSMEADDPKYANRLKGLGSEEMVRAWLDGDWNIVEGAFFHNFVSKTHIIRACSLPKDWVRFGAFDWGAARPFSYGLYAVVGDTWRHPDGSIFPRGALIRYLEWYGAKRGDDGKSIPNKGLELDVHQIAEGIKKLEASSPRLSYRVADPHFFDQGGGPSLAEKAAKKGVVFRKADNRRVAGWQECRYRLNGENDHQLFAVMDCCVDWVRTVPSLQYDPHKPEDINTNLEDHAGDEWRYACMSRPWARKTEVSSRVDANRAFSRVPTFDQLKEANRRNRLLGED